MVVNYEAGSKTNLFKYMNETQKLVRNIVFALH